MPAPIFRRILVPHDFSPQATVALSPASKLWRGCQPSSPLIRAGSMA